MSDDLKIPRDAPERLINNYKLYVEKKNLIFQEFSKFEPHTSVRKFIKDVFKRFELPEELIQNFFWYSFDTYVISLESGMSFNNFFNHNIKSHIEKEFPDLRKVINDFDDLRNFFSDMFKIVDFEYYRVISRGFN